MNTGELITVIFLFAAAALLLFLSLRHFLERGYLLNNAYIYASEKERKTMDRKPYYRQSAIVFGILGIVFIVIAGMHNMFGMSIFAAAVAGGCLGFLVWNFFPAKVFMGDTGSLFLGGLFCAMAYGVNMPILIPLVGIIYLCEAGSVMLQVGYFKLTHGKRIFKMSPIHHHFEMSGWSEVKIVWVFSVITLIAGVAAVALSIA